MAQRINGLIRAGEFGINLDETPFLCECTDPRCHAVVWLAAEEFDHLRDSGGPVLRSDPDIAETRADAPVVALAGRVGVHADRTLAI
jgi:hypothetical protein